MNNVYVCVLFILIVLINAMSAEIRKLPYTEEQFDRVEALMRYIYGHWYENSIQPKSPNDPDESTGFIYGYYSENELVGAVAVNDSVTRYGPGIVKKPTIVHYGVKDKVENREKIAEELLRKAMEEAKTKSDVLYGIFVLVLSKTNMEWHVKPNDEVILKKLNFIPSASYHAVYHVKLQ